MNTNVTAILQPLYIESNLVGNSIETVGNEETKVQAKTKAKKSKPKLPKGWNTISVDTEYCPVTDSATIPLTIQLATGEVHSEYLHPSHPYTALELLEIRRQLDESGESQNTLKVFRNCAILEFLKDNYNIEYRRQEGKRRKTITLNIFLFFSFKDIEFLFADKRVFKDEVLPRLERKRRITTHLGRNLPLDFEIRIPSDRGKMEWYSVSIQIVDICAMQGAGGLEKYMLNVGMNIDDKGTYTKAEKGDMKSQLITDVKRFLNYARGDVALHEVYCKTNEFYNKIAQLVEVDERELWGLSTGKIVASIASAWIAKDRNIPVFDNGKKRNSKGELVNTNEPGLYQYTRLSSPESIKQASHLVGNKNLLYLGMTDGGRCVKERPHIHAVEGMLIDIDIASCYANGLLNQLFPVGNPKLIVKATNFGEWEKKYKKNLVPGLWSARISWEDAPFAQDLLISKEDKHFTTWDMYQKQFGDENASDRDTNYDAAMYLTSHDVKNATLTHDIYQVIDKYFSNVEKEWIRKNAVIECFAFYPKNEEINRVTPDMLIVDSIDELNKGGFTWSTKWVRVELAKLLNVLIPERNKHKSKMKAIAKKYRPEVKAYMETQGEKDDEKALLKVIPESELTEYLQPRSTQEFIKLINNTIYGCIASCFFATDGTGISNYVVGNNITARARVLAWCMAKGLHMIMSITDGGVFDLNKVLKYSQKSSAVFEGVSRDCFITPNRHTVVEQIPLYGQILEGTEMQNAVDGDDGFEPVEKIAWSHLKSTFGELDIFSNEQFSFEVKKWYTSLELRNKSDYRLRNAILKYETIKVRGLRKSGDRTEVMIFDDILENRGEKYTQVSTEMLGLSDYRDNKEYYAPLGILPHDQISREKTFYTLTPLGNRFVNSSHRKRVLDLYDKLRMEEDPKGIAKLATMENVTNLKEWEIFVQTEKDEKEAKKEAAKARKIAKLIEEGYSEVEAELSVN